jgi:DNA primase
MLAAWRWPAHVRRVVIFADHDPAGIEAAAKLAQRVRDAGLRCDTLTPTDDGADWADVWAARECAA